MIDWVQKKSFTYFNVPSSERLRRGHGAFCISAFFLMEVNT